MFKIFISECYHIFDIHIFSDNIPVVKAICILVQLKSDLLRPYALSAYQISSAGVSHSQVLST